MFENPAISRFAEQGREVALPLDNDRTTEALAAAFEKVAERGGPGGGGDTFIFNGFVGGQDEVVRAVSRRQREANQDVDVSSV